MSQVGSFTNAAGVYDPGSVYRSPKKCEILKSNLINITRTEMEADCKKKGTV
jgi:hypothetical protein